MNCHFLLLIIFAVKCAHSNEQNKRRNEIQYILILKLRTVVVANDIKMKDEIGRLVFTKKSLL